MFHLLASELFRMRKRAQSWILIAITIVLTALVYGGFAIAARVNSGSDADSMREEVTFSSFQDFGLTMSVGFFASVMLVIIAAGIMGSEFSWNTLRPLVARASSRAGLLSAKVLALAIYSIIFILVLTGAVAGMYFIGAMIVDVPSGFSWSILGDGVLFGLKLLYSNVPYLALAFMLATVFRSNAAGIAGALGMMFIEEAIWMLLALASDFFKGVQDWGIAANASVLSGIEESHISESRAAITLGVYTVIFLGIAYAVFTRRDVTSG